MPKLTFEPTRLQHNDVPKLSLKSPNKLYITFILYVLIMFRLRCWFDHKNPLDLLERWSHFDKNGGEMKKSSQSYFKEIG